MMSNVTPLALITQACRARKWLLSLTMSKKMLSYRQNVVNLLLSLPIM
jgi:hypothetical protein